MEHLSTTKYLGYCPNNKSNDYTGYLKIQKGNSTLCRADALDVSHILFLNYLELTTTGKQR
jgi:hypothetical protein